jgi:poly(hydroxyalkanoate) depolymerase family esterase
VSLSKTIEFLRALPQRSSVPRPTPVRSGDLGPLVEVPSFGTNPGNLRMFSYVPRGLSQEAALVVVLHGCTQSAQSYDVGAGWSALADRYGFALLLPEQQTSNNPNRCFNWFERADIKRNSGEALSIRQMVDQMTGAHNIDARRIFVTGLSAGGAMTSVMLATYPDVFAGGAIIAGLPFGAAGNLQEALRGMYRPVVRSPDDLGDMVKAASPHKGPWPKVSVWHGSADKTVSPSNADEIIKQWLNVHELPLSPMAEEVVDHYPRKTWWNADGDTVLESFTITDMAHGTPLGAGKDDEAFGQEGAYLLAVGISSTFHIANFFGLTERVHKPRPSIEQTQTVRSLASNQPASSGHSIPSRKSVDIGQVIRDALTAAGLMK